MSNADLRKGHKYKRNLNLIDVGALALALGRDEPLVSADDGRLTLAVLPRHPAAASAPERPRSQDLMTANYW